MDLHKVDLKCFSEEGYRSLGGGLKPVLESIERALQLGFWVEVVTLVVPGFNDAPTNSGKWRRLSPGCPGISSACDGLFPDLQSAGIYPHHGRASRKGLECGQGGGPALCLCGEHGRQDGRPGNTACPACGCVVIRGGASRCFRTCCRKAAVPSVIPRLPAAGPAPRRLSDAAPRHGIVEIVPPDAPQCGIPRKRNRYRCTRHG